MSCAKLVSYCVVALLRFLLCLCADSVPILAAEALLKRTVRGVCVRLLLVVLLLLLRSLAFAQSNFDWCDGWDLRFGQRGIENRQLSILETLVLEFVVRELHLTALGQRLTFLQRKLLIKLQLVNLNGKQVP